MELLIGSVLALSVCLFATVTGLDRDRAFYPTVAMVTASYYALFAVMGGSIQVLAIEMIVVVLFVAASIAGFKSSLWLVVAVFAAHGAFDLVHGLFINNSGMPPWWPHFCVAFDVVAAGYLAWLLSRCKAHAAAI